MRGLRTILTSLILTTCVTSVEARDFVFEGKWRTTNRPLDGTMTCVVTDLGNENWQGRFYGVWQGVAFDYNVSFSGPASQLHGTALIDGANYTWTGRIDEGPLGSFQGTFGGDRYRGSFDLKAPVKTAQPRP